MACNDKPPFKNQNFYESLCHALDGIYTIYKEERNFRKHLIVALLTISLGFLFSLSIQEWLWLLLAIFAVLVLEMVNTVVENTVDLIVDYHYHPLAKKIKDIAAGAVLMTSLFALIIGGIIFSSKIIALLV